jgi:hypothetical protein
MSDITVGEQSALRGHWLDRLAAIDRDIAGLAAKIDSSKPGEPAAALVLAVKEVLNGDQPAVSTCRHSPPTKFVAGQPLSIDLSVSKHAASVNLYYRHVNQAERFNLVQMEPHDGRYRATIPATYTETAYPLQYYFEVKNQTEAFLYPGLSQDLTNQPYIVVRRS